MNKRLPPAQRGIALIEALVAVVILGLGLIGTVAMQARAVGALADTSMRAEAAMAAEKLIGLMTTDQANQSAYALAGGTPGARLLPWYNETRGRIPNAVITVSVAPAASASGNQVVVTIKWTRKSNAAPSSYRVSAYIAQST